MRIDLKALEKQVQMRHKNNRQEEIKIITEMNEMDTATNYKEELGLAR